MSTPKWADKFGITETDLADLKTQLSDNEEPLSWILANGHIPSDDYTRWAMEEYELPRVRDEFFEIPVDPVLWNAVKHEFAWTPYFFPLAEWQGVMLIGCLEPPQFHFPLHHPHRFVIAAAHTLAFRWRELEPVQIQPDFQSGVQSGAHSGTHSDVQREAPIASASRQRPADEVLADSLPNAPDVDLDDPDGLLFEINEAPNSDGPAVPDGMRVSDVGQPLRSTPDGLDAVSEIIDMNALDFSQVVKIAAAPAVATAPAPVSAAAKPMPPRAPVVPPRPPTPPKLEMALAPNTSTQTAGSTKTQPPPIPTQLHAQTASRSPVSMQEPAVPLATCSTLEALSNSVVAHMSAHFENALLLSYDDSILKPVKWSELLLSVKGDQPDAISLADASIFRVAARTSLPYHGYVVGNPINDAFFNAFNRGQLPKHVTVMPVMIAGQLNGMLMGISMEEVDYKGSLNAMEKLASEYSTQLDRLKEKKLGAAA